MWLGTRVCSVQCTGSCHSGGLSSASKPAPPTIESPATPKVQRLSDCPSPKSAQRGVSSPGGGGEKGGLGSSASEATPVCPAPSRSRAPLSPPTHQDVFPGKHRCAQEAACGSPAPPPPFPALHLLSLPFCQARPRWEISLGTFTPDRVLIA